MSPLIAGIQRIQRHDSVQILLPVSNNDSSLKIPALYLCGV
jgi:hypothetical protein